MQKMITQYLFIQQIYKALSKNEEFVQIPIPAEGNHESLSTFHWFLRQLG